MDIEEIEEELGYGYKIAEKEEEEEEYTGYKEEWHEHHVVSTCCNRPECTGKRYHIPDNVIVICNSCKTFSDFYTETTYENMKDKVCEYINELPTYKLIKYNVNVLVPAVLFILIHKGKIDKTILKNFKGDGEGRLDYLDINLLDFIRYVKSLTYRPQKIEVKEKKEESTIIQNIKNIYKYFISKISKSDAQTIQSVRDFYRYLEKIIREYEKDPTINMKGKINVFKKKYEIIKKNKALKDIDFTYTDKELKNIEKLL